ncbi:protein PIN-LIKES 3-like [Beta vulgaris subsp. vulgaris]|uniref:protein PIN-LIKES 3-like n=1 Tax=Beta vulgaris subsp. vulgaris TaxID=3555 RepID=UPI002036DFB0|nr:protein PIN-LIKES 3-like [Beta vulgaris subsp. vulgaris]
MVSEPKVGIVDKLKKRAKKVLEKINQRTLFAPSTIVAIVGFVVGLVPAMRRLMIGEGALVHVIQDAALLIGDGSIPSVTLVIGGNLLKGRFMGHKPLVFGVIVARYVALPMIGTAIVKGAIHISLTPQHPLYQSVLLLQYVVLPAMNISTMTQLFGAGKNECSVILLWAYILASFALTFWLTFFMWLVT